MKQNNADYQVVPYPKHRRAEAVLYRSVQHKPMIHGLIEFDVTRARSPKRAPGENRGVPVVHGVPLSPGASRHSLPAPSFPRPGARQRRVKGKLDLILEVEVSAWHECKQL